jgi:PAS domain-containing protein
MTVASSQPTTPQRMTQFFVTNNKNTRLAFLRNDFENVNMEGHRLNLIRQLDDLDCEPRQIRALLLTSKGQENKEAFDLLEEMIRSGDSDVSQRALKIFTQYLEGSITRQNLMGSDIDPDHPKKAEAAFKEVCDFVSTDNEANQVRHATRLANSCGFLYRADGDDRQNTTFRRGQINPVGKAGRDQRLFNFFHGMKSTTSGKLLHRLVVDRGLQDIHSDLYTGHLEGSEKGLSDQVKLSINQQNTTNAYSQNPLRIWGDKSLIQSVEARTPQEVTFLESFKKGPDFQFSIAGLEQGFVNASTEAERKALVLDFVTAFELLSFRKAGLMEAGRSDDIVLTKQAQKIEAQQKQMLEALQQHTGRNAELAQAVEDLFKANGTSIFMYHMKGAIKTTDRAVSALVGREVSELINDYGADAVRLNSGTDVTDSYQDLALLKNETEKRLEESTVTLAETTLLTMGLPGLLDQQAISDFERFAGVFFSAAVNDKTVVSANDANRWAKIQQEDSTKAYFGVDTACDELRAQIKTSVDPSIVYVRDNFERIYGITLDEMLDKAKGQERIFKTENEDSAIIGTRDDFLQEVQSVAKHARQENAHNPKDFEFGHAVTRAGFGGAIRAIVNGSRTLKEEVLIAKIINDDTRAHQNIGFGHDAAGHLERLLLSPELDNPNLQIAERTLGIFELERRIIDSSASNADKVQAINYIHNTLLKEDIFKLKEDYLPFYQEALNSALGTTARDYNSVIAEAAPSQLAAILKERFKVDDLTITNGKLSRSIIGFMNRETDLLIEGFEGNLPDGIFSENPEVVLETLTSLRTKVQAAQAQNDPNQESEALTEMMDTFRSIGMPIDQLIKADTLNDGSWRDNFIFSDPLFHSPSSEQSDIMKVFIEIWNSLIRGLERLKD